MKKILLLIAVVTTMYSCTSQRDILNSWLGKTKQEIILSWGPPDRTSDDGSGGQVLVYARRVVMPNGDRYWTYKMMYVNQESKIYHWRTSNEQIPPTQVDVRFMN